MSSTTRLYAGATCALRSFLVVASCVLLLALAACGRDDAPHDHAGQDHPTPAEASQEDPHAGHDHAHHGHGPVGELTQTRYICPMHPSVVSDEPGHCPICGMNLVQREVPVSTPPSTPAPEPPVAPASSPGASPAPALDIGQGTVYVCPMHPHITDDKPSNCPICGMTLVPRAAQAASPSGTAGVGLSPAMQQSLGVRTGHPQRRSLAPVFRVGARVVPDASGVVRVSARSGGWVERLHVRAVGDPVSRGAVVAEVYSPELVQAQEELLLGGAGAAGARERLLRLGIAGQDVDAVVRAGESRRRLPLRSPVEGVVAELGAREGGAVSPGETVLEVTPRSRVWIEALLFPAQRLQLGETVLGRFTLPGLPGRHWDAEASYIAPGVDPVTQTLAVRFPIGDADDALPLGAWLDADITGETREDVLVVPVSAVIRTRHGDRVVKVVGPDRFEPVEVELGAIYDGHAEIVSGLSEEDGIVLSGQFLLDSEADLSSGLQRMQGRDHGSGH